MKDYVRLHEKFAKESERAEEKLVESMQNVIAKADVLVVRK